MAARAPLTNIWSGHLSSVAIWSDTFNKSMVGHLQQIYGLQLGHL